MNLMRSRERFSDKSVDGTFYSDRDANPRHEKQIPIKGTAVLRKSRKRERGVYVSVSNARFVGTLLTANVKCGKLNRSDI